MKYWIKYAALKLLRRLMMGGYCNVIPAQMLGDYIKWSKEREVKPSKLFVYGILKQGFSLDLTREGAKFLGEATLQGANLYRIGQGVGLRFEEGGTAHGEVFEIPEGLWRWLDQIENHPHTYCRELVQVNMTPAPGTHPRLEGTDADDPLFEACWVYEHQHPQYFSGLIESGKYEANGEYARG